MDHAIIHFKEKADLIKVAQSIIFEKTLKIG